MIWTQVRLLSVPLGTSFWKGSVSRTLGEEKVSADGLWTGCFNASDLENALLKPSFCSLSRVGLVIVFTFSLHLVHSVSFPSA